MKKTRVLLLVLSVLFIGFLTACNSTDKKLEAAKDLLVEHYSDTISVEDYEVTSNLTLINTIGDATVSWASSNAAITSAGVVTRGQADVNVTLTATLTISGETTTHQFRVKVKAADVSVEDQLAAAKAALVAQYAATIGDDDYEVMSNLSLVTTMSGAAVSWTSSEPTIITTAGVVNRPSFTVGDQTVTLTATLTIGTQTTTQLFYAFVPALARTVSEELKAVLELVTVFPDVQGITGAENWLAFPTTQLFESQEYTVAWTSSHPDVLSTAGVVVRPESGADDVLVTMTASITLGDVTETKEVEFLVFAIEGSTVVESIADLYTTASGTYVKLEGVTVIGKMSGGIFISDGTTMLFIFDSTILYPNVTVGSVYDIEGVYGLYFNAPQLAHEAARPLTATPSTATPASLVGTESTVTDAVTGKPTPSPTNLMVYDYLSITGKIIVDRAESPTGASNNYDTFIVPADYTGTTIIKTLDGNTAKAYETDAIVIYYQSLNRAAVTNLDGQIVTINLLLYGWRTDRLVWYAIYLGDGTDIEVQYTDAEAVAAAKNDLPSNFTGANGTVIENKTLNLLSTLYNTTITWTSSNDAIINPETGAVTVPAEGPQVEVTLTATIKRGDVEDTVAIIVKVGKPAPTTIDAVIAATVNDVVRTTGVITAAEYYRTYFIQDATGGIAMFTSNAGMLTFLKANVGNEVDVVGTRAVFNGMRQINPWEIVLKDDDATMPAAVNVDAVPLTATDMLPYQGRLVTMTEMLVTNVAVDNFGNITVTLRRPVEGANVTLRWDSRVVLSTEQDALIKGIEVDDVFNVTAVLGWNNNPQLFFTDTTVLTATTLSDASLVALDAKDITVPTSYTEAGTITLPATGANASAIAWVSSHPALINVETGAVTLPELGRVTVTLTATLVLNLEELEVEFKVTVGEPLPTVTYKETFETNIGTTYSAGTFDGVQGITWSYQAARNEDTFGIEGTGILLRRSDEPSFLQATFPNGVVEFSFEYRKAYTGGTERTYKVDVTIGETTTTLTVPGFGAGTGALADVFTFSAEVNSVTSTTIKIYATGPTGNQQATFDNFSWSEFDDSEQEEPVVAANIIIYELYGGGGNSGAPYNNDYVILYNPTDAAVDLSYYSLHYASSTGAFNATSNKINLDGMIAAGGFYKIQLAAGTTVTDKPLPFTADLSSTAINLAGTNGKLALAFGSVPDLTLTGSEDPAVVDFVGFGSANDSETAPTAVLSNSTSAKRTSFVDTNNNSVDFAVGAIDLSYLLD